MGERTGAAGRARPLRRRTSAGRQAKPRPRRVPAVMLQGTASDVGKSVLVAGLARAYAARGLRVAPFKPVNLSNNAAVAEEGGEIGRAQAVQAQAAGRAMSVHMNPVLLKPQALGAFQVVVRGRLWRSAAAAAVPSLKEALLPKVLESFAAVAEGADLVLVEGAGGAAEVNLRAADFANMGFAEAAHVPVVLVGDVERGGAIASLVGTVSLLEAGDRARVKAYIVNKFRGDVRLFAEGTAAITARTGLPSLGVVPYLEEARGLPMEDAASLDARGFPAPPSSRPVIRVAVPRLPFLANFDDLDPLAADGTVHLDLVEAGRALPADADVVLLPGSKATLADLALLRDEGWDIDLLAHVRRGGRAIGLCGGYQMLGRRIRDPDGLEGPPGEAPGLGLLAVDTVLTRKKRTRRIEGIDEITGERVEGYEIHMGRTRGPDCARPAIRLTGRGEGARSADGRVLGCYVHGLFHSAPYRRRLLGLGESGGESPDSHARYVDGLLDRLARHLATALDLDALFAIARSR